MARYIGTDDDDLYLGTVEADTIKGGAGWDTLYGEGGTDKIWGGIDPDDLYGGHARDYLYGEAGVDFIYGDAGNDIAYGGADNDRVYGGAGADTVFGDAGNDHLFGEAGNDALTGGVGDDDMTGAAGVDRLDGGDGNDTASFLDYTAKTGAIVDLRTGKVANDGFGNAETLVSVESVEGTAHADILFGTDTANTLRGGAGDTIRGFGGTDLFYIGSVQGATLDGGTGVNSIVLQEYYRLIGEDGTLTTIIGDQDMVVDLAQGRVLNDGFGYSAAIVGFRNVTTGSADDSILGSAAPNEFYGDVGDDILSGGAGDDIVEGGMGADTMTGGTGRDIFAFGTHGEYYRTDPTDQGDVITDFTVGDRLDIQPSLVPLRFVGTGPVGNNTNAVGYEIRDGDTYVHVRDLQIFEFGSARHFEMTIKLDGVHELTAADFVAVKTAAEPLTFEIGLHALHPTAHLGDLASLTLA